MVTRLSDEAIEHVARIVLPGCRPTLAYRCAWDDFVLQVNYGDQVAGLIIPKDMLRLDSSKIAEWLRAELPPEWLKSSP